jgi:hypothetical protein
MYFDGWPTIKKSDLLKLLAEVPDDADIYITMKVISATRAAQASIQRGAQDVHLCLAGSKVTEQNTVCLVAYCAE